MLVKLRPIHGEKPTFTEIFKYHLPVPTGDTVFIFNFFLPICILTKIVSSTSFDFFIAGQLTIFWVKRICGQNMCNACIALWVTSKVQTNL